MDGDERDEEDEEDGDGEQQSRESGLLYRPPWEKLWRRSTGLINQLRFAVFPADVARYCRALEAVYPLTAFLR